MLLQVVFQVAALAEVAQVVTWIIGVGGVKVVVAPIPVHVRRGEHYPAAGHRVGLSVLRPAIRVRWRSLAATTRPAPDGGHDLGEPVGGVVKFVVYWHCLKHFNLFLSCRGAFIQPYYLYTGRFSSNSRSCRSSFRKCLPSSTLIPV